MVAQRNVTITGEETDRYGRRLGTVWLGAMDVNAAQIRKGLAWVYRYHEKPARTDYAQLEAEARRQGIGLRSVPGQTEPWRWRSSIRREVLSETLPDSARCRPPGKPDAR